VRRRLVLSTIAVVLAVVAVILTPVLLVVDAATDIDDRGNVYLRIAVIAAFAVVAAAMLATVQARQLARPLERLARSAGRVGDGDFSAPATASGIGEIDAIARSLRLSASRVDRMLASERSFTADATHQLRTGLTGLSIRLELLQGHSDPEVSNEAGAVLEQTHELNETIDELLTVARRGSTGERSSVHLLDIIGAHADDWRSRYDERRRQVVVTAGRATPVQATPGLVGQILVVLFQNALEHGAGTLAVMVDGPSIVVEDDGAGIPADAVAGLFEQPSDHLAAHGRGLALARRLAEADGGTLELTSDRPARFRLTYTTSPALVATT